MEPTSKRSRTYWSEAQDEADPGHEAQEDGTTLNLDFETGFELAPDSEEKLSHYSNNNVENRENITADRVGNTFYTMKLRKVQYGTLKDDRAALLVFDCQFGFRRHCLDRYKSVKIELEFEETLDSSFNVPDPRNPYNDPQIKIIAPVSFNGELKKLEGRRRWHLDVQTLFHPAPISMTGGYEAESSSTSEKRIYVNGYTFSDTDHHNDNIALWTMAENGNGDDGILPRLTCAVVITLPKNPRRNISLRVDVKPRVVFSLNPGRIQRWSPVMKLLALARDAPIFLNAIEEHGTPDPVCDENGAPISDFGSAGFPWTKVVRLKKEFEDQLTSTS